MLELLLREQKAQFEKSETEIKKIEEMKKKLEYHKHYCEWLKRHYASAPHFYRIMKPHTPPKPKSGWEEYENKHTYMITKK